MDDPDLLYEDLFENLEDGTAIIKTSVHEMEDRIKELSNEADQLRLQVNILQEQNERLSKQNDVLIRNISCLFKTAQMEVSRKDKQIRSLQQESLIINVTGRDTTNTKCIKPAAGKQHRDASSQAVGDEGRRHGESAVMASKAESKSNEGRTSLPADGAWKQAHRAGAPQHDCVDVTRSHDKGGENWNEAWERSADEEPRKDCVDARSNGNVGDHQNVARKRRADEEPVNGTWKQAHRAGAPHQDCVDVMRSHGKGGESRNEARKRRADEEPREHCVDARRGHGKGGENQNEAWKKRADEEPREDCADLRRSKGNGDHQNEAWKRRANEEPRGDCANLRRSKGNGDHQNEAWKRRADEEPPDDAWKQADRVGALYEDGVDVMRNHGKGNENRNEVRKRRADEEDCVDVRRSVDHEEEAQKRRAAEEYRRRRGNERCHVGGRTVEGSHRRWYNAHKGSESSRAKRGCS